MKPIVIGQHISQEKKELAQKLRHNMTPVERRLWQCLRANKLNGYHFRRQQVIGGFIVDFYCHTLRLAVEVDGEIHDASYDADRDRLLAEYGISVLRFTNRQVFGDIEGVLSAILRYAESYLARTDQP
ncbi:MAG: endonuclease domain-containing protein [Chthonomonadetes bacterium]|nr:endonuclease domain-containing protein [Chthonomonadetes bacterium]